MVIKEGAAWTMDEFNDVFGGKGTKIQPTKDDKPGGAVQAQPRLESARFQKFNQMKRRLLST